MDNQQIEIIFIDDNPDDVILTLNAFKKSNVSNKIIHLKNGEDALKFIFEGEDFSGQKFSENPKVILLDLKMPKVNGIEVLEKLKANEKTRNIPVVILTSSKEDPDMEKCYELGVKSYIIKPVEFGNFGKAIVEIGIFWALINKVQKV